MMFWIPSPKYDAAPVSFWRYALWCLGEWLVGWGYWMQTVGGEGRLPKEDDSTF